MRPAGFESPAPDARAAARGSTWVVVPAFNEAGAIAAVVADLVRTCPRVLVVDDGSSDDTAVQARRGGAVVVRHLTNRGQGAALQTGISWALAAGAERVVTFDADGQHRVEDIDRLLAALQAGGVEVALGSRFLGSTADMPLARRLLLRAAVVFTRATSGLAVTDAHNGLRAFSRAAAVRIRLRQDRMAHASELLDQIRGLGLAYAEVPVHIRYTRYSRAKGQGPWAAFRILLDYFVGRWLG